MIDMLAGGGKDEGSKYHLYFVRARRAKRDKPRKTPIYIVRKDSYYACGEHLGRIKWHGAFRQFAFFPDDETLWSSGCLEIINMFLKRINDRHRKKPRKTR